MRCRTCGSKAVINMPQHRLALCRQHSWNGCRPKRSVTSPNLRCSKDQTEFWWPFRAARIRWPFGIFSGSWGIRLTAYISTWELMADLPTRVGPENLRRLLPVIAG